MFLKQSLFFILLFAFNSAVISGDKSTCLDPSVASISGMLPGMSKDSLAKHGNLITIDTVTGVDDGGYYEEWIYRYPDYDISIVRDSIDSIRIKSLDILWANKLRIGADRGAVEKNLMVAAVVNDKTSSQYVVCSDQGDIYAILRYRDNKIENIEILMDRP